MSSTPNWLGLLKWSLAHSDGTSPSNVRPMSDDDKAFLEKVMKECVKDEPARMSEIIQSCITFIDQNTVVDNTESIRNYIYELDEIIDQIDMAQIFAKFGGLECLLRLMENNDLDVVCRGHIAAVVGAVSQNNLIVQDQMQNQGSISRLVNVYKTSPSDKLRTKALFAISCSIRGHCAAETQFALKHSQVVFKTALDSADIPLRRKAIYLARALLTSECLAESVKLSVLAAVTPKCVYSLDIDDLELRELTYQLLNAILSNANGWAYFGYNPNNKAFLESALNRRSSGAIIADRQHSDQIQNSDDVNADVEINFIRDVRNLLSSPPALTISPTSTAGAGAVVVSAAASNNSTTSAVSAPSTTIQLQQT